MPYLGCKKLNKFEYKCLHCRNKFKLDKLTLVHSFEKDNKFFYCCPNYVNDSLCDNVVGYKNNNDIFYILDILLIEIQNLILKEDYQEEDLKFIEVKSEKYKILINYLYDKANKIITNTDEQFNEHFGDYKKHFILCFLNKEVIGFYAYYEYEDINKLQNLFILQEFQNKEYGTKAVKFFIENYSTNKKFFVKKPMPITEHILKKLNCEYLSVTKKGNYKYKINTKLLKNK